LLLSDKNQAAALPAFKAFVRAAQWFSKSEAGCHESFCGNLISGNQRVGFLLTLAGMSASF
jgi:hypothetical protein